MMNFSKEQKIIGAVLGVVALIAIVLVVSNSGNEDPATLQTQAPVAPQQQQQLAEIRTFNIGVTNHPTLGTILANNEEKVLYTFASDGQNISNCTGQCVQNWPPFVFKDPSEFVIPPTIESIFDTFERTDGLGFQVSYQGKPLYFYAGDAKPGDANGNGFNGLWSIVSVAQEQQQTPPTQPQQ